MRWQRVIAPVLVLVALPLGILLVMQIRLSAETGIGATFLDPKGDFELARKAIDVGIEAGTPTVILSRRVVGGELPCLGFRGITSIEMRPTDTFGLVALKGKVRQIGPGGRWDHLNLRNSESYTILLYNEKYGAFSGQSSPFWSALRGTFGDPDWPKDSPMYVSPDGQPGLAELAENFPPIYSKLKVENMDAAQKVGDWTVTVARIHALGDTVMVAYTVTGPDPRVGFSLDDPLIEADGKVVNVFSTSYWGLAEPQIERMGPSVNVAVFKTLSEPMQPQELSFRFIVPAIHVRPGTVPCQVPGLKLENYPTPTRIPDDPFVGGHDSTPVPDVAIIGPFLIDLKVAVEPKPTEPPVPTPIPTAEGAHPPLPMPTGQP